MVGFRVVDAHESDSGDNILIASAKGNLNLIATASVALQRPYGMGVALMNLADDDIIASIDQVKR